MTSIGDAWISVHADLSPFDRELDRDLKVASTKSEASLNRTGKEFGDKVANSMSKRLGARGRDFGRSIEKATKNVVINVKSKIKYDNNRIKDFFRRLFHRRDFGQTITEEIGAAFDDMDRKGGVFNKLTQGIADAVGAGFNVSGRSPLIAILIPAIGALIGVVLAAIQAVNALLAVLYIVPGLLASIGLQVGVVMIAFQGMGKAIQGAFQAKNAKELNEALKGLTPSAQSFVRELLPLRKLFKDLQQTVQERFFNQLGGVITNLRKVLGPLLVKGFGDVAAALGKFFRGFGDLLASPAFVNFFKVLVPATVKWINMLGGSLFGKRGFITALLTLATNLTPFMMEFGNMILRNLDTLSGLIFNLATNKATQGWLDHMRDTLQLIFDLLFKVGDFLFVVVRQLDEAGVNAIFVELEEALDRLIFFFGSPAGKKALEGLINLGIIGIDTLTGLVITLGLVLAAFQVVAEWLKDVWGPQWLKTLKTMGQGIVNAANFIAAWLQRIVGAIGGFFSRLIGLARSAQGNYNAAISAIINKIREWIERVRKIPGQVASAFKGFGSLLVSSGRALIQGLINGIRAKLGELFSIIGGIAGRIGGFLGHSPAVEGPLSGSGWTLHRGQRMIEDLIKGIEMESPKLGDTMTTATNNIVFGANSIQMTFQGQVPDQAQARTLGSALGMSAANMIAARNTRLAVRTL